MVVTRHVTIFDHATKFKILAGAMHFVLGVELSEIKSISCPNFEAKSKKKMLNFQPQVKLKGIYFLFHIKCSYFDE
jgi:hypothetical protein